MSAFVKRIAAGAKNRAAAVKGTKDTTSSTKKSSDSGKRSGAKSETKKVGKESYSKKEISPDYEKKVLARFSIANLNDYLEVQKKVINTLGRDFFYDEDGNKRSYTNSGVNLTVEIDKQGIKETFNIKNYLWQSHAKKVFKIASSEMIPRAIEEGVVQSTGVHDYHSDRNNPNKKFAYIVWKTELDGAPVKLVLAIKQSPEKNRFWVHNIEIEKVAGNAENAQEGDITAYNYTSDENSISQSEENDNTSGKKNTGKESYSRKTYEDYSTRAVIERALETVEEGSAERAALEAYKRLIDRIEKQAYQAETARKSKNTAGKTAASENLAAVSENRESLSCKDSRISADDGIRVAVARAIPSSAAGGG